ncbi:MAG: hypothetical protein QM808_17730 [Steroidobacteraceae bacterium]
MNTDFDYSLPFVDTRLDAITTGERRWFDLIIEAGRESSWLSVVSTAFLVLEGSEIHITIETEGQPTYYAYKHTDGWHYDFLRDLVTHSLH